MHESPPEQSPDVSELPQAGRWGLCFTLLALLMGTSCGSGESDRSGPQTSSSSHWLKCASDVDCQNLPVTASCSSSGETEGYCVDEEGQPLELLPRFEVQFTGTDILSEGFAFETGAGIRNNELQTYTESVENVLVEGDELVIVARAPVDGGEYTSGSIELEAPLLFGRIEASIRGDVGSGSKPAFWLLPANPGAPVNTCVEGAACFDSTWPAWGGIVIFSGRAGQSSLAAVSYAKDESGVLNLAEDVHETAIGPTISTEYHLYAIEWGPERIDWFIDDEKVHTFDLTSSDIYQPEGVNPFHQPFRVKLSLSVGGLVEDPVEGDYPREMRVRSLRVLQVE